MARTVLLLVFLAACSGGRRNAAPTVTFLEPAAAVNVVVGQPVTISYVDDDPDDVASTRIFADRDGNPATTADQIEIAVRPDADGAEQQVTWDTLGVEPGTYALFARTRDGRNEARVAQAAGPVVIDVNPPPAATVFFPTPFSVTDRADLTITGSAADPHGTAAVLVAGMPADTTDGFATWRVRVPLADGRNEIEVETRDAYGARDTAAAHVSIERQGPFEGRNVGLAVDAATRTAYFCDQDRDVIFALDLATGQRRILSGEGRGAGANLSLPLDLALDAPRNRLVVYDAGLRGFVTVDRSTGDRAPLSAAGDLYLQASIAIPAGDDDAYVSEPAGPLYRLDLATGARTVLAPPAEADVRRSLVADGGGGRLFVAEQAARRFREYDLETGADGPGVDSSLLSFMRIGFDPGRNELLAIDVDGAVVAIDAATGSRTEVSPPDARWTVTFPSPSGLAYDAAYDRVLLGFTELGIVAVDRATGARTLLGANAMAERPLANPVGLGLSADGTELFILDGPDARELLAIDIATRTSRVVSGVDRGAGALIQRATAMRIDLARDRAVVGDSLGRDGSLLAIDLASGDRTLLSGEGIGEGAALGAPGPPAITEDGSAAYLADFPNRTVLRIDLATGNRTVIDEQSLRIAGSVVLDPARNRLLLTNTGFGLLTLDLATGEAGALGTTFVGSGAADLEEPSGERILVASGALHAIDLETGETSTISVAGKDPRFLGTTALAPDKPRNRVFVMNNWLGKFAIVVVEAESGDRVVFYR